MPNYTNDDAMTYDLTNHRYIITEKALMDDKGIDIRAQFIAQPDVDVPAFLKRVSVIVYSWLYRGALDIDASEYALSLPRFRNTIKEALEEQCMAMLTSRTDPSLFFSDKSALREVSPLTEAILSEKGLQFRGKWSFTIVPNDFYSKRGTDY